MKELSKINYSEQSFSRNTPNAFRRRDVAPLGDAENKQLTFDAWNGILHEGLRITTGYESTMMQASEDNACAELIAHGMIDPESQIGRKMREVQYINVDKNDETLSDERDSEDSIYLYLDARSRGEVAIKASPYTHGDFVTDSPALAEISIDLHSDKCRPSRYDIEDVDENDVLSLNIGVLGNRTVAYSYSYEQGPYADLSDTFKETCEMYKLPVTFTNDSEELNRKRINTGQGYMTQAQAENFLSLLKELNELNVFN